MGGLNVRIPGFLDIFSGSGHQKFTIRLHDDIDSMYHLSMVPYVGKILIRDLLGE